VSTTIWWQVAEKKLKNKTHRFITQRHLCLVCFFQKANMTKALTKWIRQNIFIYLFLLTTKLKNKFCQIHFVKAFVIILFAVLSLSPVSSFPTSNNVLDYIGILCILCLFTEAVLNVSNSRNLMHFRTIAAIVRTSFCILRRYYIIIFF